MTGNPGVIGSSVGSAGRLRVRVQEEWRLRRRLFALIATGHNTYYTHYYHNTAILEGGDLVQFDYAPGFKYYQSDVNRVFPAPRH